jgi:hypothetical protein
MSRFLGPKILALILCVQGCSPPLAARGGKEERPLRVSIVQLLASSERFQGKRIEVQGVIQLGNEERALYLSRDDPTYMNVANGLWLDTTKPIDAKGAVVIVEGVFNAEGHGHLGLWPGEIRDISRLERARGRAEYPPGVASQ